MNEDTWWDDPEDDTEELEEKAPGEGTVGDTNPTATSELEDENGLVLDETSRPVEGEKTQTASMTPEEERLALERERLEIERERNLRERTGRTYVVLQVRRERDAAERARNRQTIMFGALLLGTVVVLRFNNVPEDKVIQEEINILINNNSWGALFQYFVNLGVLPVGMVTAAFMRLRNALRRHGEFRAAQGRLEDLEQAALINGDDLGLGGNGNANTR